MEAVGKQPAGNDHHHNPGRLVHLRVDAVVCDHNVAAKKRRRKTKRLAEEEDHTGRKHRGRLDRLPVYADHRDAKQRHADTAVLHKRYQCAERLAVHPRALDEAHRVEWQHDDAKQTIRYAQAGRTGEIGIGKKAN